MGPHTLEVTGLVKRYRDVVALDNASFAVRSGELFGFVGGNGAGKTTAMRIILGVLSADRGAVRFDGAPISAAIRRRIGYMPEERGLYPTMKVADQLVYFARLHGLPSNAAHTSAERWISRLGLREHRDHELATLSLGNQQRVQLAAALVHAPDVLVLDEPFSGLDPVAVDVVSDVLRERAAAGALVIFSSHQLDLVERLCDRVGIIRRGQMVAVGTIDQLTSSASARLRVRAPHAAPGWADGVAGVRELPGDNGVTVLELSPTADDQAVLAAALATGPVTEFRRHRATLSELFRSVVTERASA